MKPFRAKPAPEISTDTGSNDQQERHSMNNFPHNDQPITSPLQDRFGFDPFAAALANSIRKLKSPHGSVIALNGPWGSGKSSALNLIRHHLHTAVEEDEIAIIDFACWWFRGEDALALAFFRELYAGLSPSLGDRLKQSLSKLGARLLRAGTAIGGADPATFLWTPRLIKPPFALQSHWVTDS